MTRSVRNSSPIEDPEPISWQDKHGLRELYCNLAELREMLPAIHSGAFISLPLQGSPAAFGFIRLLDEKNWALILLNFGPAATVEATIPPDLARRLPGTVQDGLTRKSMSLHVDPEGVLQMKLDPFESLILVPSLN